MARTHAALLPLLALALAACTRVGGDPLSTPSEALAPAAFDAARGVSVFFGSRGSATGGETFEWDGTTLATKPSVTGPAPREGHALAFDTVQGRTLLFGGFLGDPAQPYSAEGWAWDGTDWTLLSVPGVTPTARYGHALTFDGGRNRAVLFGGRTSQGLSSDLWELTIFGWSQRFVFPSPSARLRHALAYDSARGVTVLFGGFDNGKLADTWEWNGISWSQVMANGPSGRFSHAMAYDSARSVTVLFGGFDGALNGETWEWDGSAWTMVADTGPSPRMAHGLVYDAARGVSVLFGGFDGGYRGDTWEWDGSTWTERQPLLADGTKPAPRLSAPVSARVYYIPY